MWSFIKNLKDIIKFMIVVTLIGLIIGTIATGIELVYYQFNPKEDKVEKKAQDDIPKQVEGYLKAGALWVDNEGKSHHNSKYTRVEINNSKIVMADGSESTPFEFLEGENIGVWGYTRESSLLRDRRLSGVIKTVYASSERSLTCIVNLDDIDDIMEISKNMDEKKYNALINMGKFIVVRENTRAKCYFSEKYRSYVPVIFLEGKYEGREVYVPEKRLQDK